MHEWGRARAQGGTVASQLRLTHEALPLILLEMTGDDEGNEIVSSVCAGVCM